MPTSPFANLLRLALLPSLLFIGLPLLAEPETEWDEWEDGELEQVVHDPLEGVNRAIYRFNDTLDTYVMKPVAKGYDWLLPDPVQGRISNFLDNFSYPLVIVNDLAQGKIEQAGADFGRLFINSTVGILGFFDPATGLGLTEHKEDFGQTAAVWGLGEGPYLVLPFLGPRTLRGTATLPLNVAVDPLYNINEPGVRDKMIALDIVDTRARLLDAGEMVDESALDPYAFVRSAYLQNRRKAVSE
ncbi:MAG: VacJ family lipoprotein [Gammaproteobacteria bacterium]|nr:VacJ family lipoprotein [Gammaproteobacteria bacterium]